MPNEDPNHGQAMRFHMALDRVGDIGQTAPRHGLRNSAVQRFLGDL
jgi:hypothetical protein